jgi:hypothetical protein
MFEVQIRQKLYSNPGRTFFSKHMINLRILTLNVMCYEHILSQGLRAFQKL